MCCFHAEIVSWKQDDFSRHHMATTGDIPFTERNLPHDLLRNLCVNRGSALIAHTLSVLSCAEQQWSRKSGVGRLRELSRYNCVNNADLLMKRKTTLNIYNFLSLSSHVDLWIISDLQLAMQKSELLQKENVMMPTWRRSCGIRLKQAFTCSPSFGECKAESQLLVKCFPSHGLPVSAMLYGVCGLCLTLGFLRPRLNRTFELVPEACITNWFQKKQQQRQPAQQHTVSLCNHCTIANYKYRWVPLNPKKQHQVKNFRIKQTSNFACRIALWRLRCSFHRTSNYPGIRIIHSD